MKKRMLAGLLTAIMIISTPLGALAAENRNVVITQEIVTEEIGSGMQNTETMENQEPEQDISEESGAGDVGESAADAAGESGTADAGEVGETDTKETGATDIGESELNGMQEELTDIIKEEIISGSEDESITKENVEIVEQIIEGDMVEGNLIEEEIEEEEIQPVGALPTAIDFRNVPYLGEYESIFEIGELTEESGGTALAFGAASEEQALNATESYSAILPSTDSIGTRTCRGDKMNLRFNLFSRGDSTDMYYVVMHKGEGVTGDIIAYKKGYFSGEASLINMVLSLDTANLTSGTYTIESYMKYYSNGGYVTDPNTHYRFSVFIADERTPLNSIILDSTGKQLQIGQEFEIRATPQPENTTDYTKVVWTNSNPAVAEFTKDYYSTQKGRIKAVGYGTTYVTATIGDISAVCVITVSAGSDANFPFSDVPIIPGNWKYESVKYVYDKGIMNGIANTTWFEPDKPLTRAMFATVLYRLAGNPNVAFSNRFSDVQDNQYYSKAIIWANDNKIVSGYTDGSYGINTNITREQIAKMLFEYAKTKGYDISEAKSLDSFTDTEAVNGWAVGYMQWATAAGLITGKPNGDGTFRLDPKGEATRAECAKMLMMFDRKY